MNQVRKDTRALLTAAGNVDKLQDKLKKSLAPKGRLLVANVADCVAEVADWYKCLSSRSSSNRTKKGDPLAFTFTKEDEDGHQKRFQPAVQFWQRYVRPINETDKKKKKKGSGKGSAPMSVKSICSHLERHPKEDQILVLDFLTDLLA